MDIFLLENDCAIGVALTYSLENEGYKVTLAKSIAEAEAVISRRTFELYILDLTLPDVSGGADAIGVGAGGFCGNILISPDANVIQK